jgi:hypothetical protein
VVTGDVDERLPRGAISGQHRLWRHGRASVRDDGGGDRRRPREAQRQLGRGVRPLGCRERAQEAGADRSAGRVLPGAQGQGLRLSVQGLDRLPGYRSAARHRR